MTDAKMKGHRYTQPVWQPMRDTNTDYKIGFIPEIVCWTEVPERLSGLRNQRSRGQQGAIETVVAHRRMLFNPAYSPHPRHCRDPCPPRQ